MMIYYMEQRKNLFFTKNRHKASGSQFKSLCLSSLNSKSIDKSQNRYIGPQS